MIYTFIHTAITFMNWKTIEPSDYNQTEPYYEINKLGEVRNITTKKQVLKQPKLDRYFLKSYRISQSFLIEKYFNKQSIMSI